MDFELFRREVGIEIFDYQLLAKYLHDLKKPRDKVSALIEEGKLIRLKKGLYGPSCISLEYAAQKNSLP